MLTIRPANPTDVLPMLHSLVREMAEYEHLPFLMTRETVYVVLTIAVREAWLEGPCSLVARSYLRGGRRLADLSTFCDAMRRLLPG